MSNEDRKDLNVRAVSTIYLRPVDDNAPNLIWAKLKSLCMFDVSGSSREEGFENCEKVKRLFKNKKSSAITARGRII